MHLQCSCMFLQKNSQKSFQNEARAPKKTMPKTCYFLTSTFSRSCIDLGGSGASKLEPNWPSWAPRTLPKAFKIQFFGHMCPRCFPRGSKVAPKGSQGGPRGRFSEHFRWIWEPLFSIFLAVKTDYLNRHSRHHMYLLSDAITWKVHTYRLQATCLRKAGGMCVAQGIKLIHFQNKLIHFQSL